MSCNCRHSEQEHSKPINLIELLEEQNQKTKLVTAKQIFKELEAFGGTDTSLNTLKYQKIKAKFLQEQTKQ